MSSLPAGARSELSAQRTRGLAILAQMWVDDGYFCPEPRQQGVKYAFTNCGVSIGLQAIRAMPERVRRLNEFFEHYRSGDEYDREAITHVMACCSHYPGHLLRTLAPADSLRGPRGARRHLSSSPHSLRVRIGLVYPVGQSLW
jgi:hypothetical protein